jgi:hypothetical protein
MEAFITSIIAVIPPNCQDFKKPPDAFFGLGGSGIAVGYGARGGDHNGGCLPIMVWKQAPPYSFTLKRRLTRFMFFSESVNAAFWAF